MPSNSSTSSKERFELQPPESKKERKNRLRAEWIAAHQEQYDACRRASYLRNRESQLARQKAAYDADPEKFLARNRLYQFGMTGEQFRAMMKAQDGRCKICKTVFNRKIRAQTYHVDHDHNTGEIRSLLCHLCNIALGCAHDNPKLLRKMARYLDLAKSQE